MGAITIRLPDELHKEIRLLAEKDQRSMNKEIAWLLGQVLTQGEKES